MLPRPDLPRFPVTEHTVTFNVLTYLIDRLDHGDDDLLACFEPEELDALRNLTVRDLFRLTDQGRPLVHILIDPNEVRLCLTRMRQAGSVDADRMWLIRRGIPQVLMSELYGTPQREFRDLRRLAGMSVKPGRPRVLRPTEARRVKAAWSQIDSRLPLPRRYRALGEAFPEISIASLYGALHQ